MGCATMTLTISAGNGTIDAGIQSRGSIDCEIAEGAVVTAETVGERGTINCDIGNRGTMTLSCGQRATMTLGFVCSVDIGAVTVTVLCTSDGTPILTSEGEYLVVT